MTERKKLVKKLDTIFSLYIRKRDKRCVTCGTTENLQCGHLFSRVSYSTRWDEMNAYAQCGRCNYNHENDSFPLNNYFIQTYGQEEWHNLHKVFKEVKKYSNSELSKIYDYFEERLSKLV